MSRASSRVVSGVMGAAALIAIVTVASRIVGFGRTVVLGQTLGETCLGAAYASANTIPNVVFELVAGGALAGVVVPLLAGAVERSQTRLVHDTVRALTTWVLLGLVPAALLVMVFAESIVGLVLGSSGSCADAETAQVAASMLRVFAVQIPVYGLAVVAQGALNAHHRFLLPAAAPLVSSLVVIVALWAYGQQAGVEQGSIDALTSTGFALLAWGTTLGVLMLWVSQLPGMARTRLLRGRPTLRFPAGVAPRARRLAYAGVATVSAQWVALLVALRLANDRGVEGASLVFTLAWAVFLLPWAILAFPVVTSVFPRLAAAFEHRREGEFTDVGRRALRTVFVGGCLGAAGIVATAEPVADLMLLGAPGVTRPDSLAAALLALAPAVLGYAVLNYAGRVLFARHRGRDASWLIAGAWLLVIILSAVSTRTVEPDRVLPALGASMSVGLLMIALIAWIVVGRQFRARAAVGVGRAVGVALVGGILAAAVGRAVAAVGSQLVVDTASVWASLAQAAVVGLVTVAVFAVVLWALDGEDLRTLVGAVRSGRRGAAASSSQPPSD